MKKLLVIFFFFQFNYKFLIANDNYFNNCHVKSKKKKPIKLTNKKKNFIMNQKIIYLIDNDLIINHNNSNDNTNDLLKLSEEFDLNGKERLKIPNNSFNIVDYQPQGFIFYEFNRTIMMSFIIIVMGIPWFIINNIITFLFNKNYPKEALNENIYKKFLFLILFISLIVLIFTIIFIFFYNKNLFYGYNFPWALYNNFLKFVILYILLYFIFTVVVFYKMQSNIHILLLITNILYLSITFVLDYYKKFLNYNDKTTNKNNNNHSNDKIFMDFKWQIFKPLFKILIYSSCIKLLEYWILSYFHNPLFKLFINDSHQLQFIWLLILITIIIESIISYGILFINNIKLPNNINFIISFILAYSIFNGFLLAFNLYDIDIDINTNAQNLSNYFIISNQMSWIISMLLTMNFIKNNKLIIYK